MSTEKNPKQIFGEPNTREQFTRQIVNDLIDPDVEVTQTAPYSYTRVEGDTTEEVTLSDPKHPSSHTGKLGSTPE